MIPFVFPGPMTMTQANPLRGRGVRLRTTTIDSGGTPVGRRWTPMVSARFPEPTPALPCVLMTVRTWLEWAVWSAISGSVSTSRT